LTRRRDPPAGVELATARLKLQQFPFRSVDGAKARDRSFLYCFAAQRGLL
jgi:hypothetical protein